MDFRACQRRPGLGHAARALTETHNGAERRGSFPCVEFQYFLHSVCILYRIRAPLRVGVSWANANTGRAPRVCHRAPTAPDAALSVARGETTERTPPGCLCLAPQAWDRGRGVSVPSPWQEPTHQGRGAHVRGFGEEGHGRGGCPHRHWADFLGSWVWASGVRNPVRQRSPSHTASSLL